MYEIGDAEVRAVERVIKSGQLFRYRGGEGGECDTFERNLCRKLGCKYALLVSQGTGALICGLVGLGIGPGDEVIVPAYTFMASPVSVLAVGAIPVIAEVDDSLTIDPRDVERKITRNTRAIMPVHMVGLPSDMNAIKRVARRHHLKIIEDACQAVGGSYRGKRLATIGDVGAFSFNHFKIIACGEGGAVITSNKEILHRALIHHDGGATFRGHTLCVDPFCGWSFRVSEFKGAIMREQLKRLDRILARLRSRKRAVYAELRGSKAYAMSPIRCKNGDCGVATAIKFSSEVRMRRALECLNSGGLSASSPIDSGIHVYSNWEPILARRGSSHPKRNAFRLTTKRYRYSKTMCPQTTRILSSTVFIYTGYGRSVAEHRNMARRARELLEAIRE